MDRFLKCNNYFYQFYFLNIVLIFLVQFLLYGECANGVENMTKVLNDLNKKPYDKRIRPFYGENALVVRISFNMDSVININENNGEITLKLNLVQRWFEPRLTFGSGLLPNDTLRLGSDQIKLLWMPDTIVSNQRRSERLEGYESVLLSSEGVITNSQTTLTTVDCFMDFSYFPFDIQTCEVKFSSYSLDVRDITYQWNMEASSMATNIISNRFQVVSYDTYSRNEQNNMKLSPISTLILRIHLSAQWRKYLAIFFHPIILFTLVSLISLWISTASPKIGILINLLNVTLLNLFLVILGTGKEVHISGTAIGQYLTMCLVIIFACLFVNFGELYLKLNPVKKPEKSDKKKIPTPKTSDIEEFIVEETEGDAKELGTERKLEYYLEKAKYYFQKVCDHAYWILLMGFILLNFFYWGAHLNSQDSRLVRIAKVKV